MLVESNTIENTQSLWDRFRMGDEKAYASIYEGYAQLMFSFGMRFTSNRELVKDCIHDVFVKIYSNRSNLNTTTNIKFYLFVALKNELINVFRKNISFCSIDSTESLLTVDYITEDNLIDKEEAQERNQKVIEILKILSPRQKEVLYYRYIEELSFEEIEQLMHINYQSIQNLIQRSIKKVRDTFPGFVTISLLPILLKV